MPPTKPKTKITEFHVLADGLTIPTERGRGHVVYRGQTFTITEKMITASLDRLGNSFLDLIEDPEAQIARWGKVYLAPGACPFQVAPEPPSLYVRQRTQSDTRPNGGYYPQASVSHVNEDADRAARIARHFDHE